MWANSCLTSTLLIGRVTQDQGCERRGSNPRSRHYKYRALTNYATLALCFLVLRHKQIIKEKMKSILILQRGVLGLIELIKNYSIFLILFFFCFCILVIMF